VRGRELSRPVLALGMVFSLAGGPRNAGLFVSSNGETIRATIVGSPSLQLTEASPHAARGGEGDHIVGFWKRVVSEGSFPAYPAGTTDR